MVVGKFQKKQLDVKFIPGEFNGIANVLSRWSHKEPFELVGEKAQEEAVNGRIEEEVKMVQAVTKDEAWRILHDGHAGMQYMQCQSQAWGISIKISTLKER